jgi:hypothetical protein
MHGPVDSRRRRLAAAGLATLVLPGLPASIAHAQAWPSPGITLD